VTRSSNGLQGSKHTSNTIQRILRWKDIPYTKVSRTHSINPPSQNSPLLKRSTNTKFGFLPHFCLHTSVCAPMLPFPVGAFVLASNNSFGTNISPTLNCKKWLTMYISPLPLDPEGRSRSQEEKSGSVFSKGVSKK